MDVAALRTPRSGLGLPRLEVMSRPKGDLERDAGPRLSHCPRRAGGSLAGSAVEAGHGELRFHSRAPSTSLPRNSWSRQCRSISPKRTTTRSREVITHLRDGLRCDRPFALPHSPIPEQNQKLGPFPGTPPGAQGDVRISRRRRGPSPPRRARSGRGCAPSSSRADPLSGRRTGGYALVDVQQPIGVRGHGQQAPEALTGAVQPTGLVRCEQRQHPGGQCAPRSAEVPVGSGLRFTPRGRTRGWARANAPPPRGPRPCDARRTPPGRDPRARR
jgi:hypothetical protein